MNKLKYNEDDLKHILIEDNKLQEISLPNINSKFINKKINNENIYENEKGDIFKGKIDNGRLQKGKYTWKNGQIFSGEFSYNKFNKRGKIIFPNKEELTGFFNAENNTIEKAIYTTSKRKYQGSFKNNKLHGKFIIKNNEKNPHYLYTGSYLNGNKHGKFILEKGSIKVTGTFNNGRKNGDFKIYHNNILVFEKIYINDYVVDKLIEQKKYFENKIKYEIKCMSIKKEKDKLLLLLGIYEYLLIYNINIEQKDIIFEKKISLFKYEYINDILILKDNKLLLCSSGAKMKLIELFFYDKENSGSTSNTDENDFKLIEEYNGLDNSKNIFTLIKLSNKLIASGDCENIILWKENNLEEKKDKDLSDDKTKIRENSSFTENIYEKIKYFFSSNTEKKSENRFEIISYKTKLSHTYCMLEIKNEKNIITLAVAQPDSKTIIFLQISDEGFIKDKQKSIEKIYSIPSRKKIMSLHNDNKFLIVGCIKQIIIIIDLIKYEIAHEIYNETITYINPLKKFLILGVLKDKKFNNFEGYLVQNILEITDKKTNIISISESKVKHFGNIIDAIIYEYEFNNKKNIIIITIGTDQKILILY